MDALANIALGFSTALSPLNLFYCFVGALLGTLIGVLPGIGPVATIALLLPVTFALEPTSALIMLAGIYYGAQYGGSTTAILVNLPGESSSVVTCLDGHAMARQGKAGTALTVAALGSFFAGSVATVVLAMFAPVLAGMALQFGAAEYFSLMVLGLIGAIVLSQDSILKALAMILAGLTLGLIGTDVNSGLARFTFGSTQYSDGLSFAVVAMGLFGLGEIIANLQARAQRGEAVTLPSKFISLSAADFRASIFPVLRGTGLGSLLGILPGGGAMLSSFGAYAVEKKLARDPSRFGKGAIEGVAGPESANNAASQTSFIPMLTLGIPSNTVMALMIGAMTMHGIWPGPQVMTTRPDLFWGMIASMWIGNAILVVLNLPLIGIWVRLLRIPYRMLFPVIVVLICVGVYSINNRVTDVLVAAGFGLVGLMLRKLSLPAAPLMLGFILGPMMEENFRRAMLLSRGDLTVLVTQPISAGLLLAAAMLLALVALPMARRRREEVFQDED